jgi:guanylate kinase
VKPLLLVLSAPSGGGKTTIAKKLLQVRKDLGYSVSATTRATRNGEQDGVDYHFLTRAEFERRRASGEFLEWAEYGTQLYGTLKQEIDRIFAESRHAVLDIEIEGARQVRKNFSDRRTRLVFVLPPSAEVLVERLKHRNTENLELLRKRLTRASDELAAVAEYDYAVENEDLSTAVDQVSAILDGKAEDRRVSRQPELLGKVERLRRDVVRAAERI